MNREEELFAADLELPAAERGAFAQRECGGDAALRTRVEALLNPLERASNFMEAPTVATKNGNVSLRASVEGLLHAHESARDFMATSAAEARPTRSSAAHGPCLSPPYKSRDARPKPNR